jgi:hypothetical protein
MTMTTTMYYEDNGHREVTVMTTIGHSIVKGLASGSVRHTLWKNRQSSGCLGASKLNY